MFTYSRPPSTVSGDGVGESRHVLLIDHHIMLVALCVASLSSTLVVIGIGQVFTLRVTQLRST